MVPLNKIALFLVLLKKYMLNVNGSNNTGDVQTHSLPVLNSDSSMLPSFSGKFKASYNS